MTDNSTTAALSAALNSDQLQRFTFLEADVRGCVVTLNQSYRELIGNHSYPPAAAKLLGEFAAAATLLATLLKQDASVTIQARGSGLLSTVMAECDHQLNIRGIVTAAEQPEGVAAIAADASLAELLGEATLAITIAPAKGQRYQGIVSLESGDLAACLTDYFEQSEQLGSAIKLAANGELAAGLLLQQLPAANAAAGALADREQWRELSLLAATLSADEQLTLGHTEQLTRLFHEHPLNLREPQSVAFRCSCSEQRTISTLLALGSDEIKAIIAEQPITEVVCQFCNFPYSFSAGQLQALLDEPSIH